MKMIFLSYELSDEISGYGDGLRIKIDKSKQMCCGDTSNNSEFWMLTHFGTHMDYPFHFSQSGRNGSSYAASDFVFKQVHVQHLDLRQREVKLISAEDINENYDPNTELLILKTYYSHLRNKEEYWKNGPGFKPEVARKLKEKMPYLRAIAFDSISLTNFQNRPLGREAHHAFLMDENILIIEDVDLSKVNKDTVLEEVIVSPIRMKNADGAPVTILAKLKS